MFFNNCFGLFWIVVDFFLITSSQSCYQLPDSDFASNQADLKLVWNFPQFLKFAVFQVIVCAT